LGLRASPKLDKKGTNGQTGQGGPGIVPERRVDAL
jgi:hypothetical protein